jgi:hypothetical protein
MDKRVTSIMVEINRRLYLTGDFKKSNNFLKIQKKCHDFVEEVSRV